MEAGVVPLVNALEKKLLTGAEKNTHANSINTHSGNKTARVAFNLKLLEVLPPPITFLGLSFLPIIISPLHFFAGYTPTS